MKGYASERVLILECERFRCSFKDPYLRPSVGPILLTSIGPYAHGAAPNLLPCGFVFALIIILDWVWNMVFMDTWMEGTGVTDQNLTLTSPAIIASGLSRYFGLSGAFWPAEVQNTDCRHSIALTNIRIDALLNSEG